MQHLVHEFHRMYYYSSIISYFTSLSNIIQSESAQVEHSENNTWYNNIYMLYTNYYMEEKINTQGPNVIGECSGPHFGQCSRSAIWGRSSR